MIGCKHNIDRVIKYPEQKKTSKKKISFKPGEMITLRCLKGCRDIFVILSTSAERR